MGSGHDLIDGLLEPARVASGPGRTPGLRAQQLRGHERVDRSVEADLAAFGRRGRPQASGQRSCCLDARAPATGLGEGMACQRQQLRERQQNHGIAQLDRVGGGPLGDLASDRRPEGLAVHRVFKSRAGYGCHRQEGSVARHGGWGFVSESLCLATHFMRCLPEDNQ